MTHPVPPMGSIVPLADSTAATARTVATGTPDAQPAAEGMHRLPDRDADALQLIERNEQSLSGVNKSCNAYRGTVTRAMNQLHALMAVWYASCTRDS